MINYSVQDAPNFGFLGIGNRLRVHRECPQLHQDLFIDGRFEPSEPRVGFSNKFTSYLASFALLSFWRAGSRAQLSLPAAQDAPRTVQRDQTRRCATLIFQLKLGWLSVVCVFLCYLLDVDHLPDDLAPSQSVFAHRAQRASSFMRLVTSAAHLLPKVMGAIADHYNMSRGFIVPLICFVFIAVAAATAGPWSRQARSAAQGFVYSRGH